MGEAVVRGACEGEKGRGWERCERGVLQRGLVWGYGICDYKREENVLVRFTHVLMLKK